jgi:carbonic anhydrase
MSRDRDRPDPGEVEAVFAQGIGAICVVRSAGHVLDRAVVGSVVVPDGRTGRHNLEQITCSHVRRTVAAIKQADYVNDAVAARRIDVVGAIYRLHNGRVEVLESQGTT